MKRLLSMVCIVCMLFVFTACETVAEPPVQNTTTADPEVETTTSVTEESETPTAENPLLDKSAKKNSALLPRGFDEAHPTVQALQNIKGKSFVAYLGWQNDRFSYTDKSGNRIGEKQWLQNLSKEYGATVTAMYKSPALALSAAKVAMMSGQKLDILGFSADQMWQASALCADFSTLLPQSELQEMYHINPSEIFGGKFLSPAAVSAGLWYQKKDFGDDPAILSKTDKWDFSAFSRYCAAATHKASGEYAIGYHNTLGWNALLDAMGSPLLTANKTGYTAHLKEDATLSALRVLQTVHGSSGVYQTFLADTIPQYVFGNKQVKAEKFGTEIPRPSLSGGTVGMLLAGSPDGKTENLGWAPLPQSCSVVACAPVLAMPAGETIDADALALAVTWTARYADAYHDTLRFTYGLSFADWQSLYLAARDRIRYVPSETLLSNELSEDWHLAVMSGSGNLTVELNS